MSADLRMSHAFILTAAMTVLVGVATAGREVLMASSFGTSEEADAYYLGFAVPTTVVGIVGAAMQTVFVPAYVRAKADGGIEGAVRAGNLALVVAVLLSLAVMIFLALLHPLVLRLLVSGRGVTLEGLIAETYWIFLPAVCAGIAAKGLALILIGEGRFSVATFAPALVPISGILGLMVLDSPSIANLAAWTTAGFFLQLGLLLVWLARCELWSVAAAWWDSAQVKILLKQLGMVLPGTAIMAVTAPIDQAMASRFGSGAVAIYNFSALVPGFINGFVASVLGSVLLKSFSDAFVMDDFARVKGLTFRWMLAVLVVAGVGAAFCAVFAEGIVRMALQRGAFSAEDTRVVAPVLALAVMQVPFFAAGLVSSRAVSALGGHRALTMIAAVAVAAKLGANVVLGDRFQVEGIMVATTIMYSISAGLMLWWINVRCRVGAGWS